MAESKLRCLVVDDEPMALALVRSYAEKTPFLELRAACSSAFEALEILNDERIDLIFLDIQMPGLTGVELSRTMDRHTRIVFTTAFSEFALDGFKVEALDYLLKPFSFDEFYNAAVRAKDYFTLARQKAGTEPAADFIFVKADYKQIRISFDEILYIEGVKDYVKIVRTGGQRAILTKMSLKLLENELPEPRFLRVHRSFIVPTGKIEAIERGQVLIGGERITVAEQYKEKFLEFLKRNSLD